MGSEIGHGLKRGDVSTQAEDREEGELDCSMANIEKVWAKAQETNISRRVPKGSRRTLVDTLGLITPGVFDIPGRRYEHDSLGESFMEDIPIGEQQRWMRRDLARREGGTSQAEYLKRLEANEAHMRMQHQTMSEELGRLVEERNVQIGENQEICRRIRDETDSMEEDKKYIADELAKQMHQLSDKKLEQENLRKQIATETIRLGKDREEARKSRGVRDQYEIEISRQSTKYQESTPKVAELTEDRVNQEKAIEKLRQQNHEEKKEMLKEKELRQKELKELGKLKLEMEDYLLACQTQIEEEKAAGDVQKQHVSSTPRTVLKDYDPFEKVGAMNHVNGGKYNRKYTAPDLQTDPSRRVTIGRTETKERTPSPSHSYGSLHPFADDTVAGHGLPTLAAPVYNIHYSYGGQAAHDVGGGNRQNQGSNQNPGYTGGSGNNPGNGSGGNSGGPPNNGSGRRLWRRLGRRLWRWLW